MEAMGRSVEVKSCVAVFRFFLKDELTGRNAHAGLEQPRKVADMISGSLCHLLYRDLLVQM